MFHKSLHNENENSVIPVDNQMGKRIEMIESRNGRGLGFEQQYNSISGDFDSTCTLQRLQNFNSRILENSSGFKIKNKLLFISGFYR